MRNLESFRIQVAKFFSSYVYRVALRDTPFPQKVFIFNLSCKNDNFDSLLTITLTEQMFNMTT